MSFIMEQESTVQDQGARLLWNTDQEWDTAIERGWGDESDIMNEATK